MELHPPLSNSHTSAFPGFGAGCKLFLQVYPWGKAAQGASEGTLGTETGGYTNPPCQIRAVTR